MGTLPSAPPAQPLTAMPLAPVSQTDQDDADWSVWQLNEAGELAGPGAAGASAEQPEHSEQPEQAELSELLGDESDEPMPRNDLLPHLPENQPPSLLESRPAAASEEHSLGSLHFSNGQIIPLDRPVIVGRAPSVDPVQRPDLPRTVKIDNVDQDISRNHLEVSFNGRHVLAVDLDSANGTLVTVPGQIPQRLVPLEPFLLVGGTVVTLSNEVSFRFDAPL
jgi:hypothetical protein